MHEQGDPSTTIDPASTPGPRKGILGAMSPLALGLLVLLLGGFIAMVCWTWFLCDDAFISFRYVRNLVEGNGLVFNRVEAVEGYTNFLWVLELGLLWKIFGITPGPASIVLSALCTVAVLALVYLDTAKDTSGKRRTTLAVMALALLLTSMTFAIWTTSGLETRQFTALTVAAVMAAGSYRRWQWAAPVSSTLAGLAALTRPEGMLVGVLCIAFVWADAFWRRELSLARAWKSALPFGGIVGSHFLFRFFYYGQWLPNTYYAKHVRPWYDAGFDYFLCAGIETGAYLLLPLAFAGAWQRYQHRQDRSGVLYLTLVMAHVAYLMRVGGDHFEFRPLDFYWPLLAPLAVEGLDSTLRGLHAALRERFALRMSRGWLTLPCFLVILTYCSALQFKLFWMADTQYPRGSRPHAMDIPPDAENAKWLFYLPGMPALCAVANRARTLRIPQAVGTRVIEHSRLGILLRGTWRKMEKAQRPYLPSDAVASMAMVGIGPYYLPDLTIIDIKGLTDAVVARTPVTVPNSERAMAHDRWPPPGYLRTRGVNFMPHGPVATAEQALAIGTFATQVAPDLWLPFDATDHKWVAQGFDSDKLVARYLLGQGEGSTFEFKGRRFSVKRVLEDFETSVKGRWDIQGHAVSGTSATQTKNQGIVFGGVGKGLFSTFDEAHGDGATSLSTSPEFDYAEGDWVFMLISGGAHANLRAEVKVDGRAVVTFRGRNSEHMELVGFRLPSATRSALRVVVRDSFGGVWGHLNLDHIFLATPSDLVSAR